MFLEEPLGIVLSDLLPSHDFSTFVLLTRKSARKAENFQAFAIW